MINITNIDKLIEILKKQKFAPKGIEATEGFHMESYVHHCGTPSCIAGFAAAEVVGAEEFVHISKTAFDSWNTFHFARQWLGVNIREAYTLFVPNRPQIQSGDIRPKHAVKALELVKKYKMVPEDIWEQVMGGEK